MAFVIPFPDGQQTWCLASDVAEYTGVTADDADVVRAQAVIDVHSARTVDQVDAIGGRDLRWLHYATAYQTAWMKSQPDMYARLDLSSAPDVGSLTADALTLAPLAARSLRRLSWMRSRSLRTHPARSRIPAFTSEASDVYHPWLRR